MTYEQKDRKCFTQSAIWSYYLQNLLSYGTITGSLQVQEPVPVSYFLKFTTRVSLCDYHLKHLRNRLYIRKSTLAM